MESVRADPFPRPVNLKLFIGRLPVAEPCPSLVRQLPNPLLAMSFESASIREDEISRPAVLSATPLKSLANEPHPFHDMGCSACLIFRGDFAYSPSLRYLCMDFC